jgi:hypothetical protein
MGEKTVTRMTCGSCQKLDVKHMLSSAHVATKGGVYRGPRQVLLDG